MIEEFRLSWSFHAVKNTIKFKTTPIGRGLYIRLRETKTGKIAKLNLSLLDYLQEALLLEGFLHPIFGAIIMGGVGVGRENDIEGVYRHGSLIVISIPSRRHSNTCTNCFMLMSELTSPFSSDTYVNEDAGISVLL